MRSFACEGSELSLAYSELESIPAELANGEGPRVRTLELCSLFRPPCFSPFFLFGAAGRGGSRGSPGTRPGRARARGRPRTRADRRDAPRGPARARHAAVARALARDRRRPGASQRPSPAPGPPWGRRGAREHRKKKVKKKVSIAPIARGVKINSDHTQNERFIIRD